jgi:hypothetical protein
VHSELWNNLEISGQKLKEGYFGEIIVECLETKMDPEILGM